MRCTASPHAIALHPEWVQESGPSEAAKEGTEFHKLVEMLITEIAGNPALWGVLPEGEMLTLAVKTAEHWMWRLDDIESETRVPLFYQPDRNCIIDCHGIINIEDEERTLAVIDFKYGQGVRVEAEHNLQLAIYARSLLDLKTTFKANSLELYIDQPRLGGRDWWSLTVDELYEFTEPIRDTAKKILAGEDLKYEPSEETCQFCPIKANCPARQEMVVSMFEELPVSEATGANLPEIDGLTERQMVLFKRHHKEFARWLKDVDAFIDGKVLGGADIDGLKIVEGRKGNRRWRDEAEAATYLVEHDVHPYEDPKLISPTKASKMCALPEDLVTRSDGRPIVVPSEDKRPTIHTDDFDVIE